MRKLLTAALACLLFMAAFTDTARADTVSYLTSLGYQTPQNYPRSAAMTQFDTALGTLTKVELRFKPATKAYMVSENEANIPSTHVGTLQPIFNVSRPGGSVYITTGTFHSWSYNLDAYDGTTDFAGPSGNTTAETTSGSLTSWTTLNSSEHSYFSGTGTATINTAIPNEGSMVTTSGANPMTAGVFAQCGGRYEVRYTYTPAP